MDCVNENSSGDNESPDDVTRKRKKIANKLEWKSVANRNNRMKGVQYMGMENNNISEKPCRKLGVACSSKYCEKSVARNCLQFTESMRREIFGAFWEMSWDQKRLYVTNLAKFVEKKEFSPKIPDDPTQLNII